MVIQPKEVVLTLQSGEQKAYIIGKYPAVSGREIVAKYPLSNLPKLGDYKVSEEVMLKLMAFVGVPREGKDGSPAEPLMLATKALVDNHVPDWETLAKLEALSLEYNCSFFSNGRASTFLAGLGAKATPYLTKILTGLLGSLSQAAAQASKS